MGGEIKKATLDFRRAARLFKWDKTCCLCNLLTHYPAISWTSGMLTTGGAGRMREPRCEAGETFLRI